MVRVLLILLMLTCRVEAQSIVDPKDLSISVTLENVGTEPFQNEMVLATIHGVYRRHITLEKLVQPDLSGFNWMQLGQDHWYESQVDGLTVKNFRRRMALFPDKAGRLDIGPFVHQLTLLDDNNKWFEHEIQSEPITLDVQAIPAQTDWWFPVRNLEISDQWSNAPDQLKEGEGVLRVITLTAVGVSTEMVPPMPELTSPSAHIFAHPVKQLIELSPDGPVTYTFWRWTIKPRNPPSAILEPISFSYFDTVNRKMRDVKISAQRIAFEAAELAEPGTPLEAQTSVVLRPAWLGSLALITLLGGLIALRQGNRAWSFERITRAFNHTRLRWALWASARSGDLSKLRLSAHRLDAHYAPNPDRRKLLDALDVHIFAYPERSFSLREFARNFTKISRLPAEDTSAGKRGTRL